MGSKNTTSVNSTKNNNLSESQIESYFVAKCRLNEMWARKNEATNDAGIPDRAVYWKGFTGWAEIKAPGKKPTPLQNARMKALKEQGFFVDWFDSKEGADAWIIGFEDHIIDLIKQFRLA